MMQAERPLCSIGVPTFNRPRLLAKTIDSLRSQTYQNLEIIISDNASTDPQVEAIGRQAAAEDTRIQYFRQPENRGPRANFEFVLMRATGKYFMWAADDDQRVPDYAATLVDLLIERKGAALATFETQYEAQEGKFEFFPQCEPFYDGSAGSEFDRILGSLRLVTDNMIYGMFVRDALFHGGKPATQLIGPSLNEHPLFACVAKFGEFVSLPKVGLWKLATKATFENAKWEVCGGFRPTRSRLRHVLRTFSNNRAVLDSILKAYDALELPAEETRALKHAARRRLHMHAVQCCIGWKPQASSALRRVFW
jgi:glycosyltransferase involved in cell wall biosynthesis